VEGFRYLLKKSNPGLWNHFSYESYNFSSWRGLKDG